MVHKIIGWFRGFVLVEVIGETEERFINLCHYHHIPIWNVHKNKKRLLFYLYLGDFYRLRPLCRKAKVFVVIRERKGFPFLLKHIEDEKNFYIGIFLHFLFLLFLSTRLWGIDIRGCSYHSSDTMVKFLEKNNIYGGMAAKKVACSETEDLIRKGFEDIGWVSLHLNGSNLTVYIKEIKLVEETNKESSAPGSIISSEKGKIVSIVTSQGVAKVRAGDKVKKGQVLISGKVLVMGDNEEKIRTKHVVAKGKVFLENTFFYKDSLLVKTKVPVYTGRNRREFQIKLFDWNFFLSNPVKKLETYKKYDIIREGGQICPSLSLRFPLSVDKIWYREVAYVSKKYSKKEAQDILKARYDYFLQQKKEAGYECKESGISISEVAGNYQASSKVKLIKEQTQYRIHKNLKKGTKKNGDNGNGN